MAQILKPPTPLPKLFGMPSVFLAGSIDMGQATTWQRDVEQLLDAHEILILNPRRDDWDASWQQDRSNPQFVDQVEWELDALARADRILMYFAPGSLAPITLLELGLFADSGKLVVCCPLGYWRKGNVDIICDRHRIPQVSNLAELCSYAPR